MFSRKVKRLTILHTMALVSVVLALPLGARAAVMSSRAATSGPPVVTTGSATRVSTTTAVLHGSIQPRTTEGTTTSAATTYYFEYGRTDTYGSKTSQAELGAGKVATGTTAKVSLTATGIESGAHYRLVATNAYGPTSGKDHVYTVKVKPKKTTKDEFKLPKFFAPTVLGDTFVLTGTLTGSGNAGRSIVLQATPYPYRAPFVDVGRPILTSAGGGFSFRVLDLSSSTKFRVATVGGTPLYSLVLDEQVAVRVTLKVRTSKRKGLDRLYGTVTPASVGARVVFQLETAAKPTTGAKERLSKPERPGASERAEEHAEQPKFSSKFTSVVKRLSKSISRFSAVVDVTDAGSYRAFVELPPGGAFASGHSASITLAAAPKKHKKKAKT